MATLTSGYAARDGHHANGAGTATNLGFGIATANGSEDHCIIALAGLFQQVMNDMKVSQSGLWRRELIVDADEILSVFVAEINVYFWNFRR